MPRTHGSHGGDGADGDGLPGRRRPGDEAAAGNVRSVSEAQSRIERMARLGRAGGGVAPPSGRANAPGNDGRSPADAARRDAWEFPDRHSTPARERAATIDPVDIVTGEVFMAQTDVAMPGVLPLVLERTHVSSYRLGRAFGHTWASTLDMRLELEQAGALLVMPDGALLAYREMPTQAAVFPEAGPRLGLTAEPGGYAVSSAAAGVTWHFSGDGLPLTAQTHRCGDRIDQVRDKLGESGNTDTHQKVTSPNRSTSPGTAAA